MIQHWPLADPFYPLLNSTSSHLDQSASFQPDVGVPITRRRITGRIEGWNMSLILRDFARLEAFKTWFSDDLQGGTLPFVWRHPITKEVARFRFTPATYDTSYLGAGVSRISFNALILPGRVWFAPYMRPNTARPPDWVADYAGDVFGVDGRRGVAADLEPLAGVFLVWQRNTAGTNVFREVTYSSDIPLIAPAGVSWLVGYKL